MDKTEAKKKLDEIQRQAQELMAIIDAPERWVPEKPTLCWVENKQYGHKRTAEVVTCYNGFTYIAKDGSVWPYATPLTREEALAMVDSPTRYDWSKAPEWANWMATDRSGAVWAFEKAPRKTDHGAWDMISTEDLRIIIDDGPSCPSWGDSLEARPK